MVASWELIGKLVNILEMYLSLHKDNLQVNDAEFPLTVYGKEFRGFEAHDFHVSRFCSFVLHQ